MRSEGEERGVRVRSEERGVRERGERERGREGENTTFILCLAGLL